MEKGRRQKHESKGQKHAVGLIVEGHDVGLGSNRSEHYKQHLYQTEATRENL